MSKSGPAAARYTPAIFALLFLAATLRGQLSQLQIKVLEGEAGVHAPASRLTRPIVVEITDEVNRPVSGATISFHLPDEGPGGVFASGLRTNVATTDANGRASLRGIAFNRTPGRFAVRVIAVKDQVRAGTLSYQYIAEPKGGPAARAGHAKRKRWVAVGLVAAATAGGILVGATRGHSSPPAAPAPPVVPAVAPPTIGEPSISVGKP